MLIAILLFTVGAQAAPPDTTFLSVAGAVERALEAGVLRWNAWDAEGALPMFERARETNARPLTP